MKSIQSIMNVLLVLTCILGVTVSCSNPSSTNPSHTHNPKPEHSLRGKTFFIGFAKNYEGTSSEEDLSIQITSDYSTTGTVEIPSLSFREDFFVAEDSIITIPLPIDALSTDSDVINDLGIKVSAEQPIAVFGYNHETYTSDSFSALPVSGAGTKYYVMSYISGGNKSRSLALIIGCEDNTSITIIPSSNCGTRTAGVSYTITMNAGQTYQFLDDGTGDLTGTVIQSDKPVTVLSGGTSLNIPSSIGFTDHICDFLLPVERYGTRYYIADGSLGSSTSAKMPYMVRILASESNTSFTINGETHVLSAAGDFYEEILAASASIRSDKPVLVGKFLLGSGYPGLGIGDPSLSIVQPVAMWRDTYTMRVPAISANSYVAIVVSKEHTASVMMNGTLLDSGLFSAIDESYSGAFVPVVSEDVTLECDAPFDVNLFGVTNYESYSMAGR